MKIVLPYIYWNKKKVTLDGVVIVEVILFLVALSAILYFVVNQVQKNSEKEQPTATKSSVFKDLNPETYYDGVFLSFDKKENKAYLEVTKSGLTTRQGIDPKNIKFKKVTYKTGSGELVSEKVIKVEDIKSGATIRIEVEKADLSLDLENIKEIKVLEPI